MNQLPWAAAFGGANPSLIVQPKAGRKIRCGPDVALPLTGTFQNINGEHKFKAMAEEEGFEPPRPLRA